MIYILRHAKIIIIPNVHNISVSGTTLDQVQKLLDKSDSQVDSENV
jgi:hypothetical protein